MKRHPLTLALLLALPVLAQAAPDAAAEGKHDRERAKRMDELVVTASPLRPGGEDVVQPVEVIAGEKLDVKKAATLGETVAKDIGVQSSFFGAGVGRPIIRGQEGARVQVLSGGLGSLDVSTVSADHAVSIEPFLADQIEILKGPAALLYGSGAIGGAVNVVDGRIPEALPETAISGRAELHGNTVANERSGLLRLDGGDGSFAWHADAFRRETDDYEIPGFAESEQAHEGEEDEEEQGEFGVLPNSSLEAEGGAFGASWLGERGMLGAAVSTYRTEYGIPGHAHEGEHEGEEPEDEEEHGEEVVRIDLEQIRYDVKAALLEPFEGAESLRLRMGRNDYEHTELEGEEVGTRFDNQGTEARLELVHAPLAGWHGAAGLQFGRRDFEAVGEEAFVPPTLSEDLGLFVLEERDFEAWKFEVGGRYEQVEVDPDGIAARDFDGFSASLGAQWRATEALHFSLGFDRAVRAPTTEELFSDGVHVATGSFEQGDATLDSEVANQLELGVHLHAGNVSAKLSAFETRYDDFIYLEESGQEVEDLPLRQWTQADATFRGVEAEATLHLAEGDSGDWELRVFGDKVRASLDAGGALPRIVPARVGAGVNWEREGWRASVGAIRYADQDRVATFETPTDGYTLFDAHLAYHWDGERVGWEVFLDGTNLTDREARVHTSFLKDLAPLPGRNIAFGVRAFF